MSLPKLTPYEQELIESYHTIGESLVKMIDRLEIHRKENKDNIEVYNKCTLSLKNCIESLEQLEFAMQAIWGFEQDPLKHVWWLYPDTCTCPKIDNRDPAFFGRGRIINEDCPLHNPINLNPIA